MAGKSDIEVITAAIGAVKNGVDLYNKVLDEVIPWKTFEETSKKLLDHQADYSEKAAKLIGEVSTLLRNALTYYNSATQEICEWCDLTRRLLPHYVKLYENYKPENTQGLKAIVLRVLEKGVTQMDAAKKSLTDSVLSFSNVAGKLIELKSILETDFVPKSDYYEAQLSKMRKQSYGSAAVGIIFGPIGLIISYAIAAGVTEGKLVKELDATFDATKKVHEDVLEKVKNSTVDIDETTKKLEEERGVIGKLKTKTEATAFSISLDEAEYFRQETVKAAEELIKDCDGYLKRHGVKVTY